MYFRSIRCHPREQSNYLYTHKRDTCVTTFCTCFAQILTFLFKSICSPYPGRNYPKGDCCSVGVSNPPLIPSTHQPSPPLEYNFTYKAYNFTQDFVLNLLRTTNAFNFRIAGSSQCRSRDIRTTECPYLVPLTVVRAILSFS